MIWKSICELYFAEIENEGAFPDRNALFKINNRMLDMSVLLGYKHIHMIGLYLSVYGKHC